ncbi:enoyl-CoA hydratase/isomerase family protein [soil metagenome]
MSWPLLLREDRGPVAVLTLNRPDRRNALSRALLDVLNDALGQLEFEPGVRAVVLTGSGPTFCAGMDLKEAADAGTGTEAEASAVDDARAIADLIDAAHKHPRPTIAALQGDALGGGAGLATACDFVLMADSARIGYPEVRRGVVAAIVLHDLARQIGDRRARQLLLTGEPIDSATAERWGLVNRVVPASECLNEAIALGQSLAAGAPRALEATKRLLDEATRRPDGLRGAAAISAAIRVSEEADEGLRAFLEKRKPSWDH